jgi:superfamily II DNA helicase RecQ
VSERGENLAQASFPEMEEARAALHGLEGLDSEPARAVRVYDGPRDPDALLDHLGYDGFRPGQREPVEAALAGRDSLVVMPTGGGKSLEATLAVGLRRCVRVAEADGIGPVTVGHPRSR